MRSVLIIETSTVALEASKPGRVESPAGTLDPRAFLAHLGFLHHLIEIGSWHPLRFLRFLSGLGFFPL